jgi:hypothetical protein
MVETQSTQVPIGVIIEIHGPVVVIVCQVVHLEGAVKHLDNLSDELTQQFNTLRREEIIEEIEVILLNAGSLDDYHHHK